MTKKIDGLLVVNAKQDGTEVRNVAEDEEDLETTDVAGDRDYPWDDDPHGDHVEDEMDMAEEILDHIMELGRSVAECDDRLIRIEEMLVSMSENARRPPAAPEDIEETKTELKVPTAGLANPDSGGYVFSFADEDDDLRYGVHPDIEKMDGTTVRQGPEPPDQDDFNPTATIDVAAGDPPESILVDGRTGEKRLGGEKIE